MGRRRRKLWEKAVAKAAPQIEEHLTVLLDSGASPDDAADIVAAILDAAVPFDTLLKPPWGLVLEAADYPVFRGLLRVLARAIAGRMAAQGAEPEPGADVP